MAEAAFEQTAPGRYRVSGEMGFASATALLEASAVAFSAPEAELEFDLAGVMRADSAGLALMVEWLRQARAAHKAVVFRAVPAQLRAIAHVSDLEGILPVETAVA